MEAGYHKYLINAQLRRDKENILGSIKGKSESVPFCKSDVNHNSP